LIAGLALLSLLFFLLSKPRDNPHMRISSVKTHGLSRCEFLSEKVPGLKFRFDITPEECRRVVYKGEEFIRFATDYPSFKVVRNGWVGNELPVFFYMEYISMEGFNANRYLEGKTPILVRDGIETYVVSGFEERKFTGEDGVSVYVSDYMETTLANRLYKSGLLVSYQYPKELTDIKAMDRFALDVFRKIVVE
jgi:hypothetical protein